jgi:predicted ribosome quality control (RQC) complex YloA/Tae2 family protein
MSLNWKEIDLILAELELPGLQIQKAVQSAFDVMALGLYGRGSSKTLLISLSPGACRLHETFREVPKNDKPLRFAEFLKARIVNGRIEEAVQMGDNRIVRILVRQGARRFKLYIRLWSNAANFIVTDEEGIILDAMRRLPKRGEFTGGRYAPGDCPAGDKPAREYEVREIPGEGSFNRKIDSWYAEHGAGLSLEKLREQARRHFEGSMARLGASLERLRAKEAEFSHSEKLREYGDIILANLPSVKPGDSWLEAEDFGGERIRIRLEPLRPPGSQAERYYEQYRKAKSGVTEIREEIRNGEEELSSLKTALERLLKETNPLALQKLLRTGGVKPPPGIGADRKRPGLSFRRGDWLIIVGRDAAENDALLRRHVKGNDLWLHVREYSGSYVFIKQRPGKTVPLDILLDAGNLAVFYSRGRNNREADLFYTPVKYLRRARGGPKGLVIPTQEKNLHVKIDGKRLRELERCRIEK